MTDTLAEASSRLIFALDVSSAEEAAALIKELSAESPNIIYKVGITLWNSADGGHTLIKRLYNAGARRIFLDLKLKDIARGQVDKAITVLRPLASFGVEFLSVHADVGDDALKIYQEAAVPAFKLLGITVLTNLDEVALRQTGTTRPLEEVVRDRAYSAYRAGLHGVVCSGQELKMLRRYKSLSLTKVVPGIRPDWATKTGGQKRIVTPSQAVRGGATFIVVGRPIRNAVSDYSLESRTVAARMIIEEIAAAL